MRWSAFLLAFAACDVGWPESVGVDTGAELGVPVDASHEAHIQPLWDLRCGGDGSCHLGGADAGSLTLDDGYDALVLVPSDARPGLLLVSPGDPFSSYLMHKLLGTQATIDGTGDDMPASGSLPDEERALIEAWIRDGAAP